MASFEEVLADFLAACRYARKTGGACNGHKTLSVRTTEHMEECVACGKSVRFDLVDDKLLGFKAGCTYGDK